MIASLVDIPLVLPESPTPRGQGIHLSGIIRCMAVEGGHLDQKWVEDLTLVDKTEITDPTSILRICIGLAWESWYLPQLASIGIVDHPGECELDGVYMNPDAESLDVIATQENTQTNQLIVHEVKATYKSARSFDPDSQWMYMRQLLGYCKAKGTRYAALHVLFVCGDYSYPIKPTRKVWLIEFTQAEVDASWQQGLEYRNNYIRQHPEEFNG